MVARGHQEADAGLVKRAADKRQFLYGACAGGGLECVLDLARISPCANTTSVRAAVLKLQTQLPRRHAAVGSGSDS